MKNARVLILFIAFFCASCDDVKQKLDEADQHVDQFMEEHTCYWCNEVGRIQIKSYDGKIFCSQKCWTEYSSRQN